MLLESGRQLGTNSRVATRVRWGKDPGGVGRNTAGSWWTEVSVNSYSDLNHLLTLAKGATPRRVRGHGLSFSLTSLLVSYLPLHGINHRSELHLPEPSAVHAERDFKHRRTCRFHGINGNGKAW